MQITRFGIVGLLATLLHTVVYGGSVEVLRLPPVAAAPLAFVCALLLSYYGHHHWTFRGGTRHGRPFLRFSAVAVAGLLTHTGVAYLVVNVLHWWYGIALLISISVVPIATFLLSKYWVYERAMHEY